MWTSHKFFPKERKGRKTSIYWSVSIEASVAYTKVDFKWVTSFTWMNSYF